jgi:hypothetical protein
LIPLEYEIFRILPGGSTIRLRRYVETLEIFRTTNYIAVWNGKTS